MKKTAGTNASICNGAAAAGDILLAFGLNASYDNAAFTLTSKTVGPLWDDDTSFLDLDLAGSTFPGIEDDGSHTPILLGQLTFAALAAGNFTLGVTSDPADLNQGLIYLMGVGAIDAQTQVTVQPTAPPVPLPAAGWLLASGLLLLSRARRRS